MWDFFETVRHRHSVRSYLNSGPVEREKLHAVLETACAAPSAGDLQSYRIYVVENAALRVRLQQAAGQAFVAAAHACLVFCATGLLLLNFHSARRPATWPMVGLGLIVPFLLLVLFVHS